jgi:class 3 adenylate cyclase
VSTGEYLKQGERRNVTVLFADMQGFTQLSEAMDPEEMDSLMTRIFGGFETIVSRYGGTVEKYIGDALVAVFGVPDLHEDDPARAIGAALDFFEEIHALNRARPSGRPIAFRIGVNTGLITTGKRGEHDVVTGHAMSVASRLQSAADTNTVLVSANTKELCENDFVFSGGRSVAIRGAEDSVTAFIVTGRREIPGGEDSVLVGRKEIVDSIFKTYLRHESTRTGGCVLTGPAGIGKSRVVQEFLARARQLPDFHGDVLYARGQRYRTKSFAVVTDLLTGHFRIEPETVHSEIVRKLSEEFEIDEKSSEAFADLVTGRGTEQDNQSFVLLYLLLKTIIKQTEDSPYSAILCVENLFFVDKGSLDFFTFFLKNADCKPFFICTDRASASETVEPFQDLQRFELPPLDREQTIELVETIAPDLVESPFISAILENAGGNPLFVREYVRYARENRDAQALPTSIQNIFLASIEAYQNDYRDLLKKLSVFAHSFRLRDAEHVQRVTEGDPNIVTDALELFENDGIMIREDELYLFRHDLFKKALYNSLLNYNKKIIHRVIADLMEENGNPHPFRLLHHLIRSEEFERATDVLMAADGAGVNMEFLRYADRLLEHWTGHDDDREMSLMFLKSAILFNNGVTERIDSLMKEIIEQALRTRSFLSIANAYHLLTAYNMKSYCFRKARYCGQKALQSYTRVPGEIQKHQNLLEIMVSAELLRNNESEVDLIMERIRALEAVPEAKFSRQRLLLRLGENELLRGHYTVAAGHFAQAVAGGEQNSEFWYPTQMLLGLTRFLLCDWQEAHRAGRIVLEGPSRHHSNLCQVHARNGISEYFLGDSGSSERSLQQAAFNLSQIRNDFDFIDAARTLAQCYQLRGDLDAAVALAQDGVSAGLRHTATYPVMTLLMILLENAHRTRDVDATEFYLNEAAELVESEVLLPRRDLILFYYFRGIHEGEEDPDGPLHTQARKTVDQEIAAIGDQSLVNRLLGLAPYGAAASWAGLPKTVVLDPTGSQ